MNFSDKIAFNNNYQLSSVLYILSLSIVDSWSPSGGRVQLNCEASLIKLHLNMNRSRVLHSSRIQGFLPRSRLIHLLTIYHPGVLQTSCPSHRQTRTEVGTWIVSHNHNELQNIAWAWIHSSELKWATFNYALVATCHFGTLWNPVCSLLSS